MAALSPKDNAFLQRWTLPEEDRPKRQQWDGGYRWFRSPNVVPLEQYRQAREDNPEADTDNRGK